MSMHEFILQVMYPELFTMAATGKPQVIADYQKEEANKRVANLMEALDAIGYGIARQEDIKCK